MVVLLRTSSVDIVYQSTILYVAMPLAMYSILITEDYTSYMHGLHISYLSVVVSALLGYSQ